MREKGGGAGDGKKKKKSSKAKRTRRSLHFSCLTEKLRSILWCTSSKSMDILLLLLLYYFLVKADRKKEWGQRTGEKKKKGKKHKKENTRTGGNVRLNFFPHYLHRLSSLFYLSLSSLPSLSLSSLLIPCQRFASHLSRAIRRSSR